MLRSKTAFVGDQNLCAAIGKDAPHLTERKLRIERDCDAAGADDGQEPVEAIAVVGAIDGNRLSAGAQADGMAQESVDPADCRMQVRKIKWPIFARLRPRNLPSGAAIRPPGWPR
jgi:hypothetical protein